MIKQSFGFTARHTLATKMLSPHAHDDIELNLLMDGRMEYVVNGQRLKISPDRLFAFWAASPHEIVEAENADLLWVTIPLPRFITWSRSNELLSPLLQGRCFTGPAGLVPKDLAKRWPLDLSGPASEILAAELEIQAALIRLARSSTLEPSPTRSLTAVDRMRSAIAEGYNSDLTIGQVADAAGLHPNHAMRAFKCATGYSIGQYILYFRLAHAKRLLASTELTLPFVTIKSGFGSERRLFDAFRSELGITPDPIPKIVSCTEVKTGLARCDISPKRLWTTHFVAAV